MLITTSFVHALFEPEVGARANFAQLPRFPADVILSKMGRDWQLDCDYPFRRRKQLTSDYTDFSDKTLPASKFAISRNIRLSVLRTIQDFATSEDFSTGGNRGSRGATDHLPLLPLFPPVQEYWLRLDAALGNPWFALIGRAELAYVWPGLPTFERHHHTRPDTPPAHYANGAASS